MRRRGIEAGTLTLRWSPSNGQARRQPVADRTVLVVTVVLALVGLVMVFSASAVVAGNRFHDSIYFLKRQITWLSFGFILLHVASRLDYGVWRKLTLAILALTTVLLIAVLVPSLGTLARGARRWLRLGPVSIQPAELAKLAVVFYLASYLAKKQERVKEFVTGMLPPLVVMGLLAGLVLLQPDLGTAAVMGILTLVLLFLGGARITHVVGVVLATAPVAAALIMESPYRRQRLLTFFDPWQDPTDTGFQVTQSFLALGSGGLFGVGLGEGKQKLFFLPEAHTDFVLALVGEELGLVGTGCIMVLFALLVLKGFQIAGRAREPYGRYLALGISLLIGVQVLINAGVVTGLLPTKGLTLPLVSYGGSSLLTSLLGIGILLSIARDRQSGRRGGGQIGGIGTS